MGESRVDHGAGAEGRAGGHRPACPSPAMGWNTRGRQLHLTPDAILPIQCPLVCTQALREPQSVPEPDIPRAGWAGDLSDRFRGSDDFPSASYRRSPNRTESDRPGARIHASPLILLADIDRALMPASHGLAVYRQVTEVSARPSGLRGDTLHQIAVHVHISQSDVDRRDTACAPRLGEKPHRLPRIRWDLKVPAHIVLPVTTVGNLDGLSIATRATFLVEAIVR